MSSAGGLGHPREIQYRRLSRNRVLPRFFRFALAGFILLTIGFTAFSLANIVNFRELALQSSAFISDRVRQAGQSLLNLETDRAALSFKEVRNEIQHLVSKADDSGLLGLSRFTGDIAPKFKAFPGFLKTLLGLSNAAIEASEDLDAVKNQAFRWMTNGEGDLLIGRLERVARNLEAAHKFAADFESQSGELEIAPNPDYLAFTGKLEDAQVLLTALLNFLRTPYEQNLLIFFQNPSEIRPGGGFIGSYAVLTLKRGSITNIAVHDIYDPDGQLDLKVIPPKPLQVITKTWGARDANWFFDFTASAEKVMYFLKNSKMYSERSTRFEGAIALNVNVIETILKTIGPIELPDYGLTVSSDNFLREIQREVETGRDKTERGEPKRILKILTPLFFEKLSNLDKANYAGLLKDLQSHLARKDIMIYSADPILEGALEELGAAGKTMELSKDFAGDYLAVVNANIAGGKTDAFLREEIHAAAAIAPDGTVENRVTVERIHEGDKETEWWYRAPNKNYLQIYVPAGAKLISGSGGTLRSIPSPWEHTQADFRADPEVETVEKTLERLPEQNVEQMQTPDKTVFATWVTTAAGEKKQVEFVYTIPAKINFAESPAYRFIFERQSGVNTTLSLTFEAPVGYVWEGINQSTFTKRIENNDLPARLILDLKLIPTSEL